MINKIAIMGVGSLGTILGAYLSKAGLDVTLVDAWEEHVKALNEKGATVTDCVELNNIPVKAVTPDKMEGTYDLIIYMAKQTFNDTAIPQMVAHCGPDTVICTCQNGLPELAVAKYYPEDKIMGCTVGWSATFMGPGVSALTTKPEDSNFEMHLGRLNNQIDDKLHEVAGILENMCEGKVHVTDQLMADRWAKVMVNSTFSGMSTVAADTFGNALMDEKGGVCVCRIGRECIRVANAKGIKINKVFGIDFNTAYQYTDQAGLDSILGIMRTALGKNQGKASMLQDLEKGKKCEIKYINGVISDAGKELGIPTPYCDAVVDIVSKVENGELPLANHIDLMPDLPL